MPAWSPESGGLDIATLRSVYRARLGTPTEVVRAVFRRIKACRHENVWITLASQDAALLAARKIEQLAGHGNIPSDMPLYGIPFAVKDNIDVAGQPTTAACPDFSYYPQESATVVRNLISAGAIYIGKTNLDQFATGLTGVLSPHGPCKNAFDAAYIPGGSSSGSAIAVALGLVSFALGSDTAGSGRVPAAFNNLVGLKPTRGLLSSSGVVPACRSLDCISIFTLTCDDAVEVLNAAQGFDAADPYSRCSPSIPDFSDHLAAGRFRFGTPAPEHLEFFGDKAYAGLFELAADRLAALGGQRITMDFAPFLQTAELLYNGPWVAERVAGLMEFFRAHPDAFLPVTRKIFDAATRYSAVDLFNAMHRLKLLKRQVNQQWSQMDVLLLPTAGTIFTLQQAQADPYTASSKLGRYTNFVNLLDLCAVAVPGGFRPDGLPFGVTLMAPAFQDAKTLALAARYHQLLGGTMGATGLELFFRVAPRSAFNRDITMNMVKLAVVGAHLSGQPLNYQLSDLGATLLRACRTAPCYQLYALSNTTPPKPGLVRADTGYAIELEVWELSDAAFGAFVARIPPPLCIGTIELEDHELVKGFLCEGYALRQAIDISSFGGWLKYLKSK